jgi:hypothetical protein
LELNSERGRPSRQLPSSLSGNTGARTPIDPARGRTLPRNGESPGQSAAHDPGAIETRHQARLAVQSGFVRRVAGQRAVKRSGAALETEAQFAAANRQIRSVIQRPGAGTHKPPFRTPIPISRDLKPPGTSRRSARHFDIPFPIELLVAGKQRRKKQEYECDAFAHSHLHW